MLHKLQFGISHKSGIRIMILQRIAASKKKKKRKKERKKKAVKEPAKMYELSVKQEVVLWRNLGRKTYTYVILYRKCISHNLCGKIIF